MPVFENYTYTPSTVGTFINILIGSLTGAVDQTTPLPKLLNVSVRNGIDTVVTNATNGTPSVNDMPCTRIFYDPYDVVYDNQSNVPLFMSAPIKLYFLYAIDHPSDNFTQLRDSWIASNLNYLKYNTFADGIGMKAYTWWRWGGSNAGPSVHVQHNVDIEYMGSTLKITPTSDFGCSRADMSVLIKTYLGPDDRIL